MPGRLHRPQGERRQGPQRRLRGDGGHRRSRTGQSLRGPHDDYSAILFKALCDRLAEASAERLHERVRKELWGYAADERLTTISSSTSNTAVSVPPPATQPAPSIPRRSRCSICCRCRRLGVTLTESYAMLPMASVSGFYLSHPDAGYFAVAMIDRDQVEDYARRKGWDLATAERWLAPLLGYQA